MDNCKLCDYIWDGPDGRSFLVAERGLILLEKSTEGCEDRSDMVHTIR